MGPMRFSCHRGIAPMMWVLFALILIEATVVHGLIALWSGRVALLLSAFSLASLIWVVRLIRWLKRLPVVLEDEWLDLRCGSLRSVKVPIAHIRGVSGTIDALSVKERTTLNLALIAYPNVSIDLTTPMVVGRRRIDRLMHRLDEPDAFVAALDALMRRA